VAPLFACQIGEGCDECSADASIAVVGIDGELVEEHLGFLVRMRQLDTARKADRIVSVVCCYRKVMPRARFDTRGSILGRRLVEEPRAAKTTSSSPSPRRSNPHRFILGRERRRLEP